MWQRSSHGGPTGGPSFPGRIQANYAKLPRSLPEVPGICGVSRQRAEKNGTPRWESGNPLYVVADAEPEPPDAALIAQAGLGDRAAFGTLYRRHSPAVYRFARALCGSAAIAEDVVQDVFVVLMRDLSRYDATRSPLVAYLYGIARNLSRHRARRDRHLVEIDEEY